MRTRGFTLFLLPLFSPLACGDDARGDGSTDAATTMAAATTPVTSASTGVDPTSGGPASTTTAGGTSTGEAPTSGSEGAAEDWTAASTGTPGCEVKVFPNITVKQPVDLFLYVDGSSSLGTYLMAIDEAIDAALLQTLKMYEVDYRVLVVSKWPHACLPPLDCTAPAAPPEISSDGRLLYVHLGTGSSGVPDGYHTFIDDYWLKPYAQGAVEPFLRDDSVRVIFGFTDGEKSSNDSDGAAAYMALLDERLGAGRYTVHTVAGFTPAGILDCTAPLQSGFCLGKDDSGPALKGQQLSILTCGLRMSVCELTNRTASTLFEAIAESATTSSFQCDLPVPDTDEGELVDPSSVEVDLMPAMGAAQPQPRVDDAMACAGPGFYLEGNIVHLCPDACAAAKAEAGASLEIRHCVMPG